MLRRIGTCRKKVMGLLRLMGNKADVVKGLAKRCNESWSVAPKSDIVRPLVCLREEVKGPLAETASSYATALHRASTSRTSKTI